MCQNVITLVSNSFTDLFFTNKNLCFQGKNLFETKLSDFNKLVITVVKSLFRKINSKTITYKSHKNFENCDFRSTLFRKLLWEDSNWKVEDFIN